MKMGRLFLPEVSIISYSQYKLLYKIWHKKGKSLFQENLINLMRPARRIYQIFQESCFFL